MFGEEMLLGPWATPCLITLTTILLLYWLTTKNHDYWKKRGIPFVKPYPLLGSIMDLFYKSFHEVEKDRYTKHGLIYGYYQGSTPMISVGDPALIREILVKDFPTFHTRAFFVSGNEINDKMMSFMFGEEWKRVRNIVSPTFTTGKIKRMLSIFKDCSRTLVKNFRTASAEGKFIHAKKLYGAFTIDVIACSAFSTKLDSHNDPNNQFVEFARKAFEKQRMNWRILLLILFPPITKFLKFSFFPPESLDFFKQITFEIIEERKRTGEKRNDFLQMMMKTTKEMADDAKSDLPDKEDIASNYGFQEDINPQTLKSVSSKNLSKVELVAQCVGFFIAGYETTASTLSFATYLLALNTDVQDRLRTEVDETLKEFKGELTYEAIQSMKYLDNVISETLRLYPPITRVERTADADYKLGDTGITVPKGMLVTIPTYAIHRDPKIYPDPEKFNPDRFTPEERGKRDPYTYHPFGAGPRNCLAMRFALTEVKMCLAEVIANFRVKSCPETKVPLEFGIGQFILQPEGIILEMETRNDSTLLT